MGKFLFNASYTWSEDSIRLILSPSTEAKKTFFYVQEVGYFKTSPPYFTERSNLNSFLILYTISGKGNLKYNNQNYILENNSLFFIDCTNYHFYKTDENDDWEFIWIHFNGISAPGYYEIYAKNPTPVSLLSNDETIRALLWQIIDLHQQKYKYVEILNSLHITKLLTQLLILFTNITPESFKLPNYISELITYVDTHFNEHITLDMMAKKFSMDKYYMIKEFKKYTGTTFIEYIIKNRINRAKELLKYTDESVYQIAESVGVQNISHFINIFKAREGLTPLAYRKQWKH